MKLLVIAGNSSVKAKTQAMNQIRALLVTAPEHIREKCYVPPSYQCVLVCKGINASQGSLLESTLVSMLTLLSEL